jgi:hypothetical protein
MKDQIFHPRTTVGKIMVLCILIGMRLDIQYIHSSASGGYALMNVLASGLQSFFVFLHGI